MTRVCLFIIINFSCVFWPNLCKPSPSANLLDQYHTDDFDYGDVAREFESLLNLYKDQASDEPHNPMILRIFKRSQNDDLSLNRLPREIKTTEDIKKLRAYMRNL